MHLLRTVGILVSFVLILQACIALPVSVDAAGNAGNATKVLIYADDSDGQIKQLADAVQDGAVSVGATVKVMEVQSANYKKDVFEWADALVLGSGVYNGNPSPRILSFINSFDFMDHLESKVGGAFATAGGAAAGLELTIEGMERGLKIFGMVTVGGNHWQNADGTGVVTTSVPIDSGSFDIALARDQGMRVATLANSLKPAAEGSIPPLLPGVTKVLNAAAISFGRAKWTEETKLHATCEAYCRGWTAAIGCGTCDPNAFSFPGAAHMCIHPGPLGTGLLCRVNQTTLKVTGQSCCGVGGPCELPTAGAPSAAPTTSGCPGGTLKACIAVCPSSPVASYQACVADCSTRCSPPAPPAPPAFIQEDGDWPGACCAGGKCDACAGGSPTSDRFILLSDSRTATSNRRYFNYDTNKCMVGVPTKLGQQRPVHPSEQRMIPLELQHYH